MQKAQKKYHRPCGRIFQAVGTCVTDACKYQKKNVNLKVIAFIMFFSFNHNRFIVTTFWFEFHYLTPV